MALLSESALAIPGVWPMALEKGLLSELALALELERLRR
jgi:hypothetical protein